MSNYKSYQKHDGEWSAPSHKDFRMVCCDCSLVHRVNFRIVQGQIQWQVFRDYEATAKHRKLDNIEISYE